MSQNNGRQLDAACRILTVSSSLAGANVFINRLKALSIEGQLSTSNSRASNNSDGKLNAKTSDENVIPWTIVNRYYIADVHFAVHVIHGLSPMVFDKPNTPPAVIYVWVDGESYAKHVEELSHLIGGYEPEVSLAVRIPKSDETVGLVEDNSETQRENNTDIDTILMSYGFEYIDATSEVPLRRTGDDENILPSTDDIPHLPRVLDALSTIMWPSMISAHKGSASGGLDSKSKRERDSILEELLAHDDGTHRDSEDENDLMEQMQEVKRVGQKAKDRSNLPKFSESGALKVSTDEIFTLNTQLPWLTPNAGKTGDNVFSPIDMSLSPNDLEATSPFGMEKHQDAKATGGFSIGFEDDFTTFVSAPALNYQEGETTPDAMGYERQQDTFESLMPSAIAGSTLEPENAGERYQSLGSWSDFGGSDFGDEEPTYKSLDDMNDEVDDEVDYGEDLPTKEEIRETSAKIFRTAPFSVTVTGGSADVDEESDSDDIVPPFDLSQVMSALQQFKTDIASMDKEEERRKAAAKVALGLVYGLEG